MAITKLTQPSNHQPKRNLSITKRKKTKLTSSCQDWSSLNPDLLDKILNSLEDLKDKIQVKHTCRSWFLESKFHIKRMIEKKQRNSPMFLIPSDPEDEYAKGDCVFSLEEELEKPLFHNMPQKSSCIGSSGGWLFLLGNSGNNMFIFHPTFGVKISLPKINSLPGFDNEHGTSKTHWIRKIILWGNPFLEKDFGAALIYGRLAKLAFFKNGETKWAELEGSGKNYDDIIWHDGSIFALKDYGYIEKYIISSVPKKVMDIKPSGLDNIREFNKENVRYLYSGHFYIVESKGDFLLVVRIIGNHVYGDDKVISEDAFIEDPYNSAVCFPYKTMNFYVYKLNFSKTMWEELSNLDDHMLFIGGNQSFSLSAKNRVGCKGNSIYFTDDNWEGIEYGAENGDDCFGGHDMGVFDLTEKRSEGTYVPDSYKMEPAFCIHET